MYAELHNMLNCNHHGDINICNIAVAKGPLDAILLGYFIRVPCKQTLHNNSIEALFEGLSLPLMPTLHIEEEETYTILPSIGSQHQINEVRCYNQLHGCRCGET
ncbi:hypothetical protein GOODEAATRI_029975 [Goodea atripinnis]|uniref:Uncharacterized protein n=1 Tax=Goodea atripinnis TaxID=208336 RepID=A0ABV0NZ43_9TELE